MKQIPLTEYLLVRDNALGPLMEHLMRMTGDLLSMSLILAAPIVAATFISDVVFGILNRVAPQLNAYFMSMPVKAWGGVIMILVAFDAIYARFRDYVIWALKAVEETLALIFV